LHFFPSSDASEGINIVRCLAKLGQKSKKIELLTKNRKKFSASPFWKNEAKTKIGLRSTTALADDDDEGLNVNRGPLSTSLLLVYECYVLMMMIG